MVQSPSVPALRRSGKSQAAGRVGVKSSRARTWLSKAKLSGMSANNALIMLFEIRGEPSGGNFLHFPTVVFLSLSLSPVICGGPERGPTKGDERERGH